ncbi:hypothetical protein [Antrihabitans spumae]|uniref:Uncharacterized protein n=1 Tax=Antrihabitans spumae TaxID=3373370 RepID=A0ABW7KWP7_9NOCA
MTIVVERDACNVASYEFGADAIRARCRPTTGMRRGFDFVPSRDDAVAYQGGWADHQLDKPLEVIAARMLECDEISPRSDARHPRALASMMRSAYVAENFSKQGVHYSRSKPRYAIPESMKYDRLLAYKPIIAGVELGIRLGLIVENRAKRGWSDLGAGVESIVALTVDTYDLLGGLLDAAEAPELLLDNAPVLSVRDRKTKRPLETPKSAWTLEMETELRKLNAVRSRQSLTLDGVVRPYAHLVRIFCDDLRHGGRAYATGVGSWQNMPKSARLRTRVNGEAIVEIDMSNLYLRLACRFHGNSFGVGVVHEERCYELG